MMVRIGQLIGAAAMLAVAGCGSPPAQEERMATQDEAVSARAIVARIGLELPADARIEHAERISGQDDAARFVIVVPQASSVALLKQVATKAGEEPVFSADQNFHLGPPGDGWHPADAPGLRTAQLSWAKGAEALNLGTTTADNGNVKLYIFWHQL